MVRAAAAVALTGVLGIGAFYGLLLFLSQFTNPVLFDLRILAGAGALGGFISHFVHPPGDARPLNADRVSLFNARLLLCDFVVENGRLQIEGGFLASMVTGIGGAWGVLFVLAKAMNIGVPEATSSQSLKAQLLPGDLLTLVGLGVVAGFSATTLLRFLAKRLEDTVGRQDLQDVRREAIGATREAKASVEEKASAGSIGALATIAERYDTQDERSRLLEAAHSLAQEYLAERPNSPEVILADAMVWKRLAEKNPDAAAKEDQYTKAINLCSEASRISPALERAFYNRACYRALKGEDLALVLADMKKAIDLLPENKRIFSTEDDIASIRATPEVKALLD